MPDIPPPPNPNAAGSAHLDALLHRALLDADFTFARRALALGAPIDKSWNGNTYAMIACYRGHAPSLNFLLEQGCDPLILSSFGRTALHIAAESGHTVCVEILLNAHARSALITDPNGFTPLMFAARYGHLGCAQLLIPHSPLNALDLAGHNALAWAALQGHAQLAECLIPGTHDGPWTQLLLRHPGGPRILEIAQAHWGRSLLEASTPAASSPRNTPRI